MNGLMVYSNKADAVLFSCMLGQNINSVFDKVFPNLSVLSNQNIPAVAVSPDGRKLVAGHSSSSSRIANDKKYFVIKDLVDPSATQPLISFDGYLNGVACSDHHYVLFGQTPFLRVYDWQDNIVNLPTTGLGDVSHVAFSQNGKKLFVLHKTAPYLRVYNIDDLSYTDKKTSDSHNPQALIFYLDDALRFIDSSSRQMYSYDDNLNLINKGTANSIFNYNEYRYIIKHPNKENIVLVNSGSNIYEYNLQNHQIKSVISFASSVANFNLIEGKIYVSCGTRAGHNNIFVYDLDYQQDNDSMSLFLLFQGNICQFAHAKFDTGKITGIVRDVNNMVASRRVRAYDRKTGELVAQTQSNTQGEYTLELPNQTPVDVQFMVQDGELLPDLFYANAMPELIP